MSSNGPERKSQGFAFFVHVQDETESPQWWSGLYPTAVKVRVPTYKLPRLHQGTVVWGHIGMATPMGQRAGCPVSVDYRVCIFRCVSKYKRYRKIKCMMVSVDFYACLVSRTGNAWRSDTSEGVSLADGPSTGQHCYHQQFAGPVCSVTLKTGAVINLSQLNGSAWWSLRCFTKLVVLAPFVSTAQQHRLHMRVSLIYLAQMQSVSKQHAHRFLFKPRNRAALLLPSLIS